MPTIDDAFPSKYLKASDLPEEGALTLTIEKVTIEEIGPNRDRKPVIHFYDNDKSFVCNKTNANTIAKVTGSRDFDDWGKKTISLGRAEVEFGGDMVEAIRVRIRAAKGNPANPPKVEDDEIPF